MRRKINIAIVLFIALISLLSSRAIAQPCPLVTSPTPGTTSVCLGSRLNIHCTGAGTCGETWSSSNTSIATVASTGSCGSGTAQITGVTSGTATIGYNNGFTICTYAITVNALPTTPTISGSTSVCAGSTTTLTGTPSGGGWQSANLSIATVGSLSGVVTGVSAGTTNISYFIIDAHHCVSPSATQSMTVIPIPSAGSITGNHVIWATNGTSGTLNLTATGATTGSWSIAPAAVASVTATAGINITLQGTSAGNAIVTYTASNNTCGAGASATAIVTVDPMPKTPQLIPDTLVFGTGDSITGMNVAALVTNPETLHVSGYLLACAWYDYTNPAQSSYRVFDLNAPSSLTATTLLLHTPNTTPDIVLADSCAGCSDTTYMAAVAYSSGGTVYVSVDTLVDEYYPAHVFREGNYATYSYTGTSPNTVRIDAIAEYNNKITRNPSNRALPLTRHAIVVWDDNGDIYAKEIDLSAAGGIYTITAPKFIGHGKDPDVAAVQRYVSATSSLDEIGLITYTDVSNSTLYYSEIDMTAGTVMAPETLDVGAIYAPRIDAIDDSSANDTASSYAVFKIVAQVFNNVTGHYETRSYDNLIHRASPDYWTPSSVICTDFNSAITTTGYDHYAPTVAVSGEQPPATSTPTLYTIQQFTEFSWSGMAGGTKDILFVEPVDYSVSDALAGPSSLGYYYYWVSQAADNTAGNYANAIAPACNLPGSGALSAWVYPDGGSNNIYYKFTGTTTVDYYVYRPGQQPIAQNTQPVSWILYPNPATGQLTIVTADAAKEATYDITDMLGRTHLHGAVAGKGTVDLNTLPPGNYIVSLHGADGASGAKMFVKQ